MITKMKQILGAAAAMLMLAACGSPKTNLPLEGTQWKLTEMDGKADPAFAAGEDTFNFTLDPSRMMVYVLTLFDDGKKALVFKGTKAEPLPAAEPAAVGEAPATDSVKTVVPAEKLTPAEKK